jgi:hypothetical protein
LGHKDLRIISEDPRDGQAGLLLPSYLELSNSSYGSNKLCGAGLNRASNLSKQITELSSTTSTKNQAFLRRKYTTATERVL